MNSLFLALLHTNQVRLIKLDFQKDCLVVWLEALNLHTFKSTILIRFLRPPPVDIKHFEEIGLGAEPRHIDRLREFEGDYALSIDICYIVYKFFLPKGLIKETSEC